MMSLLIYITPYALGIVALVAAISAFNSFRVTRTSPYYRIRRDAIQAIWRWVAVLIVCIGGIYGSIQARRAFPPPDLSSMWPAPSGPTPTFSLLISPTPGTQTPGEETKNPMAGPPTITPTQPTPTLTPTPFIATVESLVTPPVDSDIRLTAISSGISLTLEPVGAGTNFPAGLPRIYFFFEFSNMVDGVSWSMAILLDGTVVRSESDIWELGENGPAYRYFDAQGGWPAGNYEAQFYIGDRLVTQGAFTLQ